MRPLFDRIPLSISMIGLTAVMMLVPAAYAFSNGNAAIGRGFLYSAILFLGLYALLAIATYRRQSVGRAENLFLALALIYVTVPAVMAVPLAEILTQMRFVDAWFEMISSFTTTGASLIDLPRRVPDSVHLWRGIAGWMGGLFILAAASALLAPLRLGGFDLLHGADEGMDLGRAARLEPGPRLRAHAALILPVYASVTLALWILLILTGLPTLDAVMQSMAAVSTSGILPRETLGGVGLGAEVLLFGAMALALTRRAWPGHGVRSRSILRDPEIVTATALILLVTAFVLARHALGAYEAAADQNLPAAGRTVWGAAFTSLSFLTTTGFVSEDWIASRVWSGLTPPGIVLMGLALLGGGVATTAGGLKLYRVYALYRLSRFESERMIYPSMVVGANTLDRFTVGQGARSAWLFAMVFTLTAIFTTGLLLLFGLSLETALVFTVAALTNTGPLTQVAAEAPLYWVLLNDPARAVLALAMILGRLEILVFVAALIANLSRR